jgi:sugar lactone lactonase YvrE
MGIHEEPGAGSLHLLDIDGTTRQIGSGYSIPNGLAWSADGRICYFIDSGQRALFAIEYDLATGSLGEHHQLATWEEGHGVPDGMCLDSDETLWIAIWDGSRLERRSMDGELIQKMPVPVQRPTSVVFGGVRARELFVTSASVTGSAGLDGGVLVIRGSGSAGAFRSTHPCRVRGRNLHD